MLLLTGQADVVLAGGAEAPLHASVLSQLDAAGVLAASHSDAARACRPFDAGRSGTVLGEGAGFLVLETLASARGRGAVIHARLAGWGICTEPGERAGISGGNTGLLSAMRNALDAAGLAAEQVGHVQAHGTGTVLNDQREAAAIHALFGDTQPLVSGTKPVTGHCMGATAALESILALQSLTHGMIPPTANCDEPDPACAIRIVQEEARHCGTEAVMTNSSGFWGNHASIVFNKLHACH
jgi:3-oxoacyl-[acyl-carrier-protein] synthase II